jgi:hypothetical protein
MGDRCVLVPDVMLGDLLLALNTTSQQYIQSRIQENDADVPPGEGGPKGRMRDPHNSKIPHPLLSCHQ